MKLTFDKAFNGNCIVYWINKHTISKKTQDFIPGGGFISLSQALAHNNVGTGIVKIEILNWSPILDFLQQEKLIKIENGKVTLLF